MCKKYDGNTCLGEFTLEGCRMKKKGQWYINSLCDFRLGTIDIGNTSQLVNNDRCSLSIKRTE
jgi:hypothetical protein